MRPVAVKEIKKVDAIKEPLELHKSILHKKPKTAILLLAPAANMPCTIRFCNGCLN